MVRFRFYICLAVILMVGLPYLTFSQSPSQLFQQGLLKENGEGDLEAAVTIYEKIVADATADRSLRAKAQLHIGMCYEKLGKPETQKAYERVLQDYADQPEAARLAQEALARLSPKNDEQDGQLNLRFVMGGLHEKGIRELALSLSPEGDRVAYRVRKADRYELWVSDFAGFHARLLTSDGWPDRPSWSPDGNFLVYTAQRTDSLSTLWVISLEDSTERQLTKLESRVPAWSPDGKTIAFAGDANEGGLYVISAAGGTPQFLTEAGPKYGYHWSADSKKIAFRRIGESGNRDVSYYDLERGRRIRITSDPAVDNPAGWSPDGRKAYFFSNRKGNFQLWKVHLSEQTGEPVGSPTQVTDVQDVDVVYAVQTADCRKMAVQLKKNTDRLGVVAANGEKVVKILREGYQPQWLDEQTLLIGTADGNLATLILNRNEMKKLTNQGNIISGLVSPDRLSVAFVAIDTARTKPELLGKRTESMWGEEHGREV